MNGGGKKRKTSVGECKWWENVDRIHLAQGKVLPGCFYVSNKV